ncbi:PspC domain-containing protein [Corynebacterium sp. CCUG 59401]|nr:PspC domain-containing protein [Corynebacterium pseudogenitalium]
MNETLKLMWDTRPPRIPKKQGGDAMVAGICEGIGVRYQIDATLVRVAFVALSLVFGVGVFLYVLCGFLMPRFGLSTSPAQAISTPKPQLDAVEVDERGTGWGLLILLFIFFPSLSVGIGDNAALSALGGLVLAGAAWWALHQHTPVPPVGVVASPRASHPTNPASPANPPSPPSPPHGEEPVFPRQSETANETVPVTAKFTAPEGYPHPAAGRTTPPSWDPLGAAPELWHLPDPGQYAQPEPEPKPSRRLWLWIPVAVVLAVIAVASMYIGSEIRNENLLYGKNVEKITEPSDVVYIRSGVGELTVDLTEVKPLDSPSHIDIVNRVGSVKVIMPDEDVQAHVTCETDLGDTACPPEPIEGDGQPLTVNVHQNIGTIMVYWWK